ncbi:MAG TPA: response regulator [Planctomycetota bacterium]|nr:response regulator [Planctomycetota bacterium]
MTLRRILFVDDEPQLLDGLRDLLRRDRKRWEMVFAGGGEEALEELSRARFDVVVTDMRMRGIDGAELLRRVRERRPGIVRIVLTGHAEKDALIRAVPVAHEFLSKPCDGDLLRAALERSCAFRDLSESDAVRAVLARLGRLPAAARAAWERLEALAMGADGDDDVERALAADEPARRRCSELARALGLDAPATHDDGSGAAAEVGGVALREAATASELFALPAAAGRDPARGALLRRAAVAAARAARRSFGGAHAGALAFSAGLLHDAGDVILDLVEPERAAACWTRAVAESRPRYDIEREVFGVSHAEIGACVLGRFGLPLAVVEAVAAHHRPGALTRTKGLDVAAALHVVAARIDSALEPGSESVVDDAFLERQGFAADAVAWSAAARDEIAAATGAVA